MYREKVILVGASEHAKVIIDMIEKQEKYELIGLLDANIPVGEMIFGYSVLGKEAHISVILAHHPEAKAFISIGDNWLRSIVKNKLLANFPKLNFASIIHPSAQIGKGVKIGSGVAIMAGVIVNSDSIIGDFTILNTNSSLDHDCQLNNFASLGPGVITGGKVQIDEFTAIGIGAVIKHGISIGKHAVIGASALVLNDFGNHIVAYGSPAKEIRDRKEGEKYL